MAQKRVQVIYTGHVQGVGFRYSVHRLAGAYPITGTVANLRDGSVELVAEGNRADLRAFLTSISDSHLGGYIRGTHEDWCECVGEFTDFSIRSSL